MKFALLIASITTLSVQAYCPVSFEFHANPKIQTNKINAEKDLVMTMMIFRDFTSPAVHNSPLTRPFIFFPIIL